MMIMGQITAVTAVGQLVETYVLIVLVDPAAAEDLVEAMVEVVAVAEAAVEDAQGAVAGAPVVEVAAAVEAEVKVLEEVAAAVPRTSLARMSTPAVDP